MMRVVCIAALVLAGCIEDSLVPCGDLMCPAGSVCASDRCMTEAEFAACLGKVDGDDCQTDAIADGSCIRAGCVAKVCGDGFVARGEACDDGNQLYGDGCSGDCQSDETCGNGVADGLVGEECDRGIRGLSGDGCTSVCTVEAQRWSRVESTTLDTRDGHAMAYDERAQRIVLFGYATYTGDARNDTWEWDGDAWLLRHPPVSPPGRGYPAMTYDAARERVVMFGGISPDLGVLDDTWEWDGVTWTKRTPATSPPPRSAASMAYDPVRHKVVLFGGSTPGFADDTWEWDGTNWTEVLPATRPPPRMYFAMAYEPGHGVVMVSGHSHNGVSYVMLADAWQFDGTNWSPRSPSAPQQRDHTLAYDPGRGHLILVAGTGGGPSSFELVGATWQQMSSDPGVHPDAPMAYDAAHGTMVLASSAYDTWKLDTSAWSHVPQASFSGRNERTPIVYDSLRGRSVLVSPDFNGGPVETWEWYGDDWLLRTPQTQPVGGRFSLAYDAKHAQTVLFGGQISGVGLLDQTWVWDGAEWTDVTPAGPKPPARARAAMVYDLQAGHVLLFGGVTSEDGFDDTWVWDGAAWTQLSPPTSPPLTSEPRMVYDAHRDRTVLYGAGQTQDEMWEFDGTTWMQVHPTAMPPQRRDATLVYDPLRERVLLYGGMLNGNNLFSDTWEYDGTTWKQLALVASPGPLVGHTMVFDAASGTTLLYGGSTDTIFYGQDLWRLGFTSIVNPRDLCIRATDDTDRDGLFGCADPDCWYRCTPLCPPGVTTCPAAPACGDGTCSVIEDFAICPSDCSGPPP